VATSAPLDQFIVTHPDYFFSQSPESGLVNPNNAVILSNHVKCAAFELPFDSGEAFGGAPATATVLQELSREGVLHPAAGRWHWASESFPAEAVSLRSASIDNFVIIDTTSDSRVIGEMDRSSVPTLLHEEAIYLHAGTQYQVEKLDWNQKKAFVRRVSVDYYTDANLAVDLKVLDVFGAAAAGETPGAHGEVAVSYVATIFKKIKFDTHENLGWGKIHLPEENFHSHGFWLALPAQTFAGMGREELQSGLQGVANLLVGVAPLFLMCDPKDLGVVMEVRAPFTGLPTVFVYEKAPAGVGFSERLFAMRRDLYAAGLDLARQCPCESGCPSCVGPLNEVGPLGKPAAQRLLNAVGSAAPRL
jgi:DEAD/DEAH box helicase domain-containing protein